MIDLVSEAVALQGFLESRHWRFCFIGGLAVQHWGEPRLTRDLDVSLLTGFGGEEAYIDQLLRSYPPRIQDARHFALSRRVLLLKSAAGIGIDVSLAALPFEDMTVSRSVLIELLPGCAIRLCSPEDLIVMKVFAGREIDLRDVRSIIVRQGSAALDWSYIETHLADLAELRNDTDLLPKLRRIRVSAESAG